MQRSNGSSSNTPDCPGIVEKVYQNPNFLNLINKLPEAIREDVRQEVAVTLLEKPCDKIAAMYSENQLLFYTVRTCLNIANGRNSRFSITYKNKEFNKAVEYLYSQSLLPSIPITSAVKAKKYLESKNQSAADQHEAIIFNKYVELGSGRKVAAYFKIPVNHVCRVVKKVKTELKCLLVE